MADLTRPNSLRKQLNEASPNVLADMLRSLQFGDVLRALPTHLRRKTTAVGPYNIATIRTVALADDAKAEQIISAYGRAGGVTAGPLIIDADAATAPVSGHIKITPTGDIATLGTDAWTDLDVTYLPKKYDIVEVILPCVAATGVCALPAAVTGPGAVCIMEADVLVGGLLGSKFVVAPAAAAPATTLAGLNLAKNSVFFAIADAVTSVHLKLAVASAVDVDAKLTAASGNFL